VDLLSETPGFCAAMGSRRPGNMTAPSPLNLPPKLCGFGAGLKAELQLLRAQNRLSVGPRSRLSMSNGSGMRPEHSPQQRRTSCVK
jgi:hypothetical protein